MPELPVTANQIKFLQDLGVAIPTQLSKREASRLIDEAIDRQRPATAKQLDYLRVLGVPFELPVGQATVTKLIRRAYTTQDYAWRLFCEEFQPVRGPKGQFAKGSLKGVTHEFARRQLNRMSRFILSDPKIWTAVEAIMDADDRRGIPHDETRAAILAHLRQPEIDLFSWIGKLLRWLFPEKRRG